MEGLKEAVSYIAELGHLARSPRLVEIGGKTYGTERLARIDKPEHADPIKATTLTALIEYIRDNGEEIFRNSNRMIIHVITPTLVSMYSGLDPDRNRESLFECSALTPGFREGSEYSQEDFIIALQAAFIDSGNCPDLDAVRMCAANIVNTKSEEFSDDGVTQQAVIKTGVASKDAAIVPNPVTLTPWRTFQEILQPSSTFVFRIREAKDGSPLFRLVCADGGAWKNTAMWRIKQYISDAIAVFPDRERFTVIA